jgi:hypothetical protein
MRKILFSLTGLALSTMMHAKPAMWGTPVAPRPESEALAQSVPIADVHMHFNPIRQTVEQMMKRMQDGKCAKSESHLAIRLPGMRFRQFECRAKRQLR